MSISTEKKSSSFWNLFKPAPYREEMQDSAAVQKSFRYWRFRIFYSMYIGYSLFYFTRKSFTFAMPGLSSSLGMDKIQLGILGTVLSITYGVSKFLSGIMGDKSNPRYFMAIGLFLTGVFNLCFGLSSSLVLFAIFWGLNGWFQGWGWPGCAKLLTHWYSQSERGRWWSVWNTSHNLGGALIPLIATFALEISGWRLAMYIPGILCMVAGVFLIDRLRDTPQSLGLPSVEKFKNDYPTSKKEIEKESLPVREILIDYVLKNRFIWILAISYFFVYIIRTAVNDWTLLYLIEEKGYSFKTGGICVSCFEIGGFLGSLAAGWASDKIFQAKRNPINFIFSIGVLLSLIAFWQLPYSPPILDGFLIFLMGFFIFGPQMLIGIAATELSHKKAAATATGFAGCFAYLGAATAGFPLGYVMQNYGWQGFFSSLSVCAILAAVLILPLWSVKNNPREANA